MIKNKNKRITKAQLAIRHGQCTRKIGYSDKSLAHMGKKALELRGEDGIHVYKCPHCTKFHVGHKQKNP